MKSLKALIVIVALCGFLMGTYTSLLSWGLINLFTDREFTDEGLGKAEAFDPDRDILYLPKIGDRDIFESARDLSICRNREVRRHIYLYLTSKRPYLVRAIERSHLYHDAIKKVFRENDDIPEELVLLPLLESCFDPYAVSTSKAVGLWQIMDNTAGPLGLRTDRWIDERRDVEKSTAAAIRHLRAMYTTFGRWDLALAAYNGGAGYLKRTMESTGVKDYWQLIEKGLIRQETSEYVPKFVALLLIYNNQRLFGIHEDITLPEKANTAEITLVRPADLRDVARLGGEEVETIKRLNPELKTLITPPTMPHYRLLVPLDAEKKIKENPKELYRSGITRVITHRVRPGETLARIARRYKKKHLMSSVIIV
ncbi:MAG: transglycosylase SLT domain-containing protein [Spirochaetes bacterium]|nr:transglycosylase SLT domain-containing protein [Spirochaetota bacterium]